MKKEVDDKFKLDQQKHEVGSRTAGMASFMVFGRFISLFLAGVAFIVVARILGPSTYGIYTLAISFSGFFGSVADLGVGMAINKFIAEYTAKKKKAEIDSVISNGYLSVLITGLFFTLIAFSMSHFIAMHLLGNANQQYVIQVVSFCILGAMLFSLSYNIMIGFGKGYYVAIVIITQSLVQAILSIILSITGFGAIAPIFGILIGYMVSVAVVILILLAKFKTKIVKPSIKRLKELLGFSYAISIYNILRGIVWNLSPIILGVFATIIVVGNFGVAIKTSAIISNVTDALGLAVLPMFAYTISTKSIGKEIGKFYNYALYMTFAITTPALLYLSILSKQFSFTIFSAKYLLAPSYISIISVGTLLWIIATYTNMLLISSDRVKEMLKYSIIIAFIEITLLFVLAPKFGGLGVTFLLYIVTPVLITLFMSKAAKDLLGIKIEIKKLAKLFGAGIISAAFLIPIILLLPSHYIITLVLGAIEQIIIYPVILSYTGAAGKEDLKLLRQVTAGIPVINRIIRIMADYSAYFARK
ncbi:MAG: oligosaccharide flippase family protein [Candidatus Micrarchaeales archaeon]